MSTPTPTAVTVAQVTMLRQRRDDAKREHDEAGDDRRRAFNIGLPVHPMRQLEKEAEERFEAASRELAEAELVAALAQGRQVATQFKRANDQFVAQVRKVVDRIQVPDLKPSQ